MAQIDDFVYVEDNLVYVDASSSPNPGPTEYRGLYQGKIIFSKHIGDSSNNIGEFLAIVHALAYIKTNKISVKGVYSDSKVAISWFEKKKVKSTYVSEIVQRAEKWLKANEAPAPVLLYDTAVRGENPADYGRKGPKWQKQKNALYKKEMEGKVLNITVTDECMRHFLITNGLKKRWHKFVVSWEKNHKGKKTTINI